MDFNLDILLPKSLNINDLGVYEDFIQWGKETYHRDPPVYNWRDKLLLQKNKLPVTYQRVLDNYITLREYNVLTFKDNSLFELKWAIYNNKDVTTNPITEFMDTVLIHFNGWCLILSLDDENIGLVKEVDNSRSCSSILMEGLKWKSPQSLVILNRYK